MFKKVLLVEDDAVTAFLTERVIRTGEYFEEVVLATDGQEALDSLSALELDLIILDISMPGLSGFDFLENQKEESQDKGLALVPVLILSSSVFPDDLKRSSMYPQVIGHELKPLTPELLQRIVTFLQSKKA